MDARQAPAVDTPCVLFGGKLTKNGYARITLNGKRYMLHRLNYERIHGPIPKGLELDHLCRVRHCVNPDHLEPVTHAENVRRGRAGAENRGKSHCPQGHPYSGANLYVRSNGNRQCYECKRAGNRARRRIHA